jgi:aldehyde dehydrogenase (NAD+)
MHKLANLINANAGKLAKAESEATGQPVVVASNWILPSVSSTFRYYAGWADMIEGWIFLEEGVYFNMTQFEPHGVCAGIGPRSVTLM